MSNESVSAIPLDFKLFVEGVPVPMIRATITCSVNRPAMAQVHIPATSLSVSFEPRSAVHIFYMDANDPYESDDESGRKTQPKYKLLFEGEYLGLGFRKSQSNRSTILRCADISNNFDYAMKFIMTASNPVVSSVFQRVYTGSSTSTDIGVGVPISNAIARLVTGESSIIEGVRELINNVFAGGEKIDTNSFLRSVEERFGISKKVFAIADEDIKRLIAKENLLNLIRRGISARSATLSLGQMITMFLGMVLYHRSTVLSPKADSRSNFKSFVLTPNIYFSPPPKCNVLFPDHITSIGYQDNFMQAPTRMFLQAPPFSSRAEDPHVQIASTFIAPKSLSRKLPLGGISINEVSNDFGSTLTAEEEIKGIIPSIKTVGQPEYAAQAGAENLQDVNGEGVGTARAYLLNLAEYELDIGRAAARSLETMTGGFNPGVVVGAPAAVLDPEVTIYGILESVSHSFSSVTGEGSSTSYSIMLPRMVPLRPTLLLGVSRDGLEEIDRISKLIDLDLSFSKESRKPVIDLKLDLDFMVESGMPLELIQIAEQIDGSTVDERSSKEVEWKNLAERGISESLPSIPRWINSKFNNSQIDSAYRDLYGCDSILAPFDENDRFKTSAEAAQAILAKHQQSEDPFGFAVKYSARSETVTQTDFELHYGLIETEGRTRAYSATGPFSERKQVRVRDYVRDLNSRTAHLG
jgi:hypothetical protein